LGHQRAYKTTHPSKRDRLGKKSFHVPYQSRGSRRQRAGASLWMPAKWTFIVTAPWALHKRYRPLRGTLGVRIVPFPAFWLTISPFDLKGITRKSLIRAHRYRRYNPYRFSLFLGWDR
jgi:hypothetical protein